MSSALGSEGNLVENPLKNTPEGGTIAITVHQPQRDTVESWSPTMTRHRGRRTPPRRRAILGDVRYDTPGVGLGLNVVSAVASRMAARWCRPITGPALQATLLVVLSRRLR